LVTRFVLATVAASVSIAGIAGADPLDALGGAARADKPAVRVSPPPPPPAPPAGSEFCPAPGHSAVIDRDAQRAWLCTDGIASEKFPITTAITQPDPGTYKVYAKDRLTTSTFGGHFSYLDNFVAFARGKYSGARVAFHAVPRKADGTPYEPYDPRVARRQLWLHPGPPRPIGRDLEPPLGRRRRPRHHLTLLQPGAEGTGSGGRDSVVVSMTATHFAPDAPIMITFRDTVTFEELYARQYAPMVRLAHTLVDTRPRAEEVVQDAFAAVFERYQRIDHPEAYLRVTVLNGCRRVLRRRVLSRNHPVPPSEDAELGASHVIDAIRRLPHKQRSMIVLRYDLQLTDAEIADTLAIPIGTVKSTLYRALGALREELL
jgi:RNA polymerase sigma factor (sigma-70 family)